jgi:ribosomal protein S18 acetylase RimI-like enzyme
MDNCQTFAIHTAGLTDLEDLADLIRRAYLTVALRFGLNSQNCPKHPSNCTPDWVQDDMRAGKSYFWLGDREPVGCVAIEQADNAVYYLERLAVLPARRGQGLGRRLVAHAREQIHRRGGREIGIGIIDAQTELKQWYRRLGFEVTAKRDFEHLPFRVALMACRLD